MQRLKAMGYLLADAAPCRAIDLDFRGGPAFSEPDGLFDDPSSRRKRKHELIGEACLRLSTLSASWRGAVSAARRTKWKLQREERDGADHAECGDVRNFAQSLRNAA